MAKRKWMRTIDSAQRKVVVDGTWAVLPASVSSLEFHIQGLTVNKGNVSEITPWADMAEYGVSHHKEPALTIWQRLLRKEAKVGSAKFSDDYDRVELELWTNPALRIEFDLRESDGASLFREAEIMVLSAGFHYRTHNSPEWAYKEDFF